MKGALFLILTTTAWGLVASPAPAEGPGGRRLSVFEDSIKSPARHEYANEKECLATHEPDPSTTPDQLKAWVPEHILLGQCTEASFNEAACGTSEWCKGAGKRNKEYANEKECLAAHEPDPSTTPDQLKAWVPGSRFVHQCSDVSFNEAECGTSEWCKEAGKRNKEYANEKECLAAHKPDPSSQQNRPSPQTEPGAQPRPTSTAPSKPTSSTPNTKESNEGAWVWPDR